jgi:hypothetical protein
VNTVVLLRKSRANGVRENPTHKWSSSGRAGVPLFLPSVAASSMLGHTGYC